MREKEKEMRVANKKEARKEKNKMKANVKGKSSIDVHQISEDGPNMQFRSSTKTAPVYYPKRPKPQVQDILPLVLKHHL